MQIGQVLTRAEHVDRPVSELKNREPRKSVLMVTPDHFDVVYVINPHMAGNIGTVDKDLAKQQWKVLKFTYEQLGLNVKVLQGEPGLPDMVFCANQSFPYLETNGKKAVIESKMASNHRQPEVAPICKWYKSQGYRVVLQNTPPVHFEGMGDAIWHPRRRLLYVGFGYRTDLSALKRAANLLKCPVVALKLTDPAFYHLDTALSVLDEETALYAPKAFDSDGIQLLKSLFPRLISAEMNEAKKGFVTNGHCPDERHFIVHKGSPQTNKKIEAAGFKVIEVNTSEFIKAGGSVFCMKMMLP